ncbi:alpha/beta hydrolase family protein [Pseudomonas sp. SA3-5]|uniref:Alpha/beta hydrolase family protein n=1 Tax=Pseudomonas aestuarii TaxID=3018340 RepID=A0ABT4XHL6_9PSED|nr:alpha/beta hydrolase family protein [Pseudomonas aestuarii]MDA7087699.1 alpha/beta hydrolase family protein [Pseudomonas aestuarii]
MPRAICTLLAALSLSLVLPLGSPLQAAEPSTLGEAGGEQDVAPDSPAADLSRPPQAERSAQAASALIRQLPDQEQQLLHAGDESFLALWLPANAAEAHGVVVLVAGDGESADWPKVLGPLRRKLPDAGWHSLTLSLPDPQDDLPALDIKTASETSATAEPPLDANADEAPPVTDAAQPDPSSQTGQPTEAAGARHAQRIKQRIAAALQLARQQQAKQIVLLGHGSGGYWSMRYLSEEQPADVRSLLLVDVKPAADASPGLDELQASLTLATGDFYYQDRPLERSAATERAQASKRQKHPAYTQVALKALPGNPEVEQEQLFRRLRGWLTLQLPAG